MTWLTQGARTLRANIGARTRPSNSTPSTSSFSLRRGARTPRWSCATSGQCEETACALSPTSSVTLRDQIHRRAEKRAQGRGASPQPAGWREQGGGENRDNGGLLDTAEFWYAAPMPRVAPDAECAICLGALITTATSTESPAPGTSSARRSSPAPAAAAAPDDVVALRYCGHVFHLVRVTHSAWHTHAVQPGTGTELI
eukprot:COSAG01_NODE_980_length_12356_cov_77.766093_4_plen_199_part_00